METGNGVERARMDMKKMDALMALSALKSGMAQELHRLGGVERMLAIGSRNTEEMTHMLEETRRTIDGEVDMILRKLSEYGKTE